MWKLTLVYNIDMYFGGSKIYDERYCIKRGLLFGVHGNYGREFFLIVYPK